jgi:hypothetical protein
MKRRERRAFPKRGIPVYNPMRDDNVSRWLFPDPPLSATLNFAIICLEAKKVAGAFVRSFRAMTERIRSSSADSP